MGQYEAGVHAQNILRKVMNRSDMGSVVNEANDRWTNGRKRIGSYNMGLLENVDYNDPENDYKFELGFNSFINKLNEHYHVDGYYIDSDGKTSGNIYVCEECDDGEVYMINGMNDDVAYVQQEAVWQDYLVNKARLENRLKIAVSEALVLSDERIVNKVDSLISLQEGIGDSLSNAWTKFKNFIAKLWQKFTEFISRTLNNDKGYLTKYKEIILHREVKLDEVTFDGNYTQGEKNILQFSIYKPTSPDINSFPAKNEGDSIKKVQVKVLPQYTAAQSLDFSEFCLKYFKGGTDSETLTSNAIQAKMASMFNWCYNYDKVEKKLKRDQSEFDKAYRVFEQNAKDTENKTDAIEKAKLRASQTTAYTGGQSPGSIQDTHNAFKDAEKKYLDAQNELPALRTAASGKTEGEQVDALKAKEKEVEQLKNAMDKAKDVWMQAQHNTNKQDNTNKLDSIKYNKGTNNNETTKTESVFMTTLGIPIYEFQIGAKAADGKTVGSASQPGNLNLNVSAIKTKDAGDTGALVDNSNMEVLNERLNMYCISTQTVFSSLLQAAQTINKQYMQVIKAHVQSYAGNMDDSTRIAGGTAESRNQSITMTPAVIQDLRERIDAVKAITDEKTREVNIHDLLDRAANATRNSSGFIQKSFASLDELEAFLSSYSTNPVEYPKESESKEQPAKEGG